MADFRFSVAPAPPNFRETVALGWAQITGTHLSRLYDDLLEDDAYVVYDQQLTQMVQAIAENTDASAAWEVLVYSRYNSDSALGQWLARHRAPLPFFLRQTKSAYWPQRVNAVFCIAEMLFDSKTAGPPF